MKKALLAALLLLAGSASASDLIIKNFDVDSLSYYYPILCTPTVGPAPGACPGPGYSDSRKITTAGVSSTTVTSVSSNGAFTGVAKGDVLIVSPDGADLLVPTMVYVAARASADSITVDPAIDIAAAGAPFRFWRQVAGTGGDDDGWFNAGAVISQNALIDITQISVTGGIDYKLECRHALAGGGYSTPFSVVATTNKTAVSISQAAWSLSGTAQGPWDQCRIGLKVGSADDDGVTFGASSDDIDFKEYINSYSVEAATNDKLRVVEDAGGTPFNCDAVLTAAAYTGATLCTEIATQLNACGGTNTYSCTYSTSTHKFTVARATGALSVDIAWASDAVNITCASLLGYTADDTGGTSYVSDSATGESAEKTASMTDGLYISGTTACAEVQSKMQAASGVVGTYSCSYSVADDKVTISATGITQLMILWATGTNNATSADTPLGFSSDSTGALSYEGSALGADAANEVEEVTVTVAGIR